MQARELCQRGCLFWDSPLGDSIVRDDHDEKNCLVLPARCYPRWQQRVKFLLAIFLVRVPKERSRRVNDIASSSKSNREIPFGLCVSGILRLTNLEFSFMCLQTCLPFALIPFHPISTSETNQTSVRNGSRKVRIYNNF
jgi:hypothetical protein